MLSKDDLVINETAYQWSVRLFSLIQKRLGVTIREHALEGQLESGQIFLFNHFARFEAIIPQYIIYRDTGAHCRSVAAAELCAGNSRFARFLRGIGGVPNNLNGLLAFLAAEILRGRKVVIFPEGGMVKDRQVVDEAGDYSIYSPTAMSRRRHHKGATATALILELFKQRILSIHEAGETARLGRWVEALELEDEAALIAAARRPTQIVPANITFYPIRAEENILNRASDFFAKDLRDELREELLVESTIILKRTDMDIRFGAPVKPDLLWRWWDRLLLSRSFTAMESLDSLFALDSESENWVDRLATGLVNRHISRLRDHCMTAMYSLVTVNLGHLLAQAILLSIAAGHEEISRDRLSRALYLSLKALQGDPAVHLHDSLLEPQRYGGLIHGDCRDLDDLLEVARASGLIEVDEKTIRFLPKLTAGQDFHQVRLENALQVYANEVAPIRGVVEAVQRVLDGAGSVGGEAWANLLFDDEMRRFDGARETFTQPAYDAINRDETATQSGAPLLLLPETAAEPAVTLGVVLVHGLLASPAEVQGCAERLRAGGHPVLAVRLAGHGTSPADLQQYGWQDWLASLERGFDLMRKLAERIVVVGFSTGGGLALQLAADRPPGLAGVVAVSAPVKLRNRAFHLAPVLHGANKMTAWSSNSGGWVAFHSNDPEHPDINYRKIPVRAIYELKRFIEAMKRRLPDVVAPVTLIQGSDDPVVDPKSAGLIYKRIASQEKALVEVKSDRHGILYEEVGETLDVIRSFLDSVADCDPARTSPRATAVKMVSARDGDVGTMLSDAASEA